MAPIIHKVGQHVRQLSLIYKGNTVFPRLFDSLPNVIRLKVEIRFSAELEVEAFIATIPIQIRYLDLFFYLIEHFQSVQLSWFFKSPFSFMARFRRLQSLTWRATEMILHVDNILQLFLACPALISFSAYKLKWSVVMIKTTLVTLWEEG